MTIWLNDKKIVNYDSYMLERHYNKTIVIQDLYEAILSGMESLRFIAWNKQIVHDNVKCRNS
jgi:hypothetical protein